MVLINDLSNNLFIFPRKQRAHLTEVVSRRPRVPVVLWFELKWIRKASSCQKRVCEHRSQWWAFTLHYTHKHHQTRPAFSCGSLDTNTGWGMTDVRWHKCNSLFDLWLSSAPLGYCCSLKTSHRSQLEICHSICSKMSA